MSSELRGRVCLVTGANTGIGRVTATELARRGARVWLACRSEEKTRPVVDAIVADTGNHDVEFVPLDLASFDSVRRCAAVFLESERPLHVLVNNAGFAGKRGLTREGFELTFGVNHLGHFLLTALLMERIRASAPARIVNVSSGSHYRAATIDFEAVRRRTASVTGIPEYEVSKLANVLFTVELARRLGDSGVTAVALHPGVVASDAWRQLPWPIRPFIKLFMLSTEEGARTTLYCATAPESELKSGGYYDACRLRDPNPVALDPALGKRLWDESAAWTGESP